MRKLLISLITSAMVVAPLVGIGSVAKAATINTAIRGESALTVYWYAPDGKRYTFPNADTYFTWFSSFDSVVNLSDAELQTIPLGNQNVTFRPGAKLVKVQTDPKVYAVSKGGVLRHVTSESLARDLYGADWRLMVKDVPDAFFTNYTVGTPIYSASDYNVSNEYNGVSYPQDSLKNSTGGNTYQTGSLSFNVDRTSIRSGDALSLTANYTATFPTNGRIEIKNVTSNGTVKTCYSSSCYTTIYPTQETGMNSVQYIATVKNSSGSAVATQYSPVVYFTNSTSYSNGMPVITSPVQNQVYTASPRLVILQWNSEGFRDSIELQCATCNTSSQWSWDRMYTVYADEFYGSRYNASYHLNDLPQDGQYRVRVKSYDANGNATSWTSWVYFTYSMNSNGTTADSVSLNVNKTTASNEYVTLTAYAGYGYAGAFNGYRMEVYKEIGSGSTFVGSCTLNAENNACSLNAYVSASDMSPFRFYVLMKNMSSQQVGSAWSPYITVANNQNGTYQNDGENYINGITLQADTTSIDSGDRVKLTANAYNTGNWNYTGNRIEIRDLRNNNTVKTCYDQSWCVVDLYVSRLGSENQVQYEARIYDRNGAFVMSQFGPVIYFSGTGSTNTNTGSTSDALTGYANIEFNPNSNLHTDGTVNISANVLSTNARTSDLETRIYDERYSTPIAVCHGAITCTASYFTGTTPINTHIYATITSVSNPGTIQTSQYQLTTTY